MLKFSDWTARRAVRCTAASTMVLAAGALLASTGPAFAEMSAQIKAMSFTTQSVYNQVIRVVSSDNKKWDSFKPGSVSFGAHVMIDTRHYVLPNLPKGWTKYVGIVLGPCYGANCVDNPLLWQEEPYTKDYENQMAVTLNTSQIPTAGKAAAHVPIGKQIIAKCNEKVTMGGGAAHSFNQLIPVTFVADTVLAVTRPTTGAGGYGPGTVGTWTNDTDHFRNANVTMKVECEAFERERAEDVEDTNMSTKNIELKVVAPASPTTKPNLSTSCRKAKLTVRMEADQAGPVKYRLWSKVGGGPTTSKVIDMWASEAAPGGKFEAEHSEWVTVTKTSTVQAMAEDLINPIGQSTGWKEALVRCEPTTEGLADVPRPSVDDPVVQPLGPIKPNPNATGNNTIVEQPRPTHDKPSGKNPNARPAVIVTPKRPKKPAIKVAPKPRLVCLNGKVSRGKCFCPPRTKKKRIARNAYRCERAFVKPKRITPKALPKRIVPSVRPKRFVPKAAPKRTVPRTAKPATRRLKRQTR